MTEDTTDDAATAESPTDHAIEPSAPEEFGLVQVWWGDGKGKTTASLGMGMRAAGHGYRVHLLQFMKGGTAGVENVRGEYNAIAALPGFSYENAGHFWLARVHGRLRRRRTRGRAPRARSPAPGKLSRARPTPTSNRRSIPRVPQRRGSTC